MTSSQFIEDNCLELPVIENGVVGLGDLWNCQESKPLHLNLFKKKIEKYVKATPLASKKFTSHHIRSSSDMLKTVDVGGEVSLDILCGLVKVGGSANFESKNSSDELFEKISFKLDMTTFSIELLPEGVKRLNKNVESQLESNQLHATHVVNKIIIGASVDACITVTYNKQDEYKKISGIHKNTY
jgi:hypothetical protein